MSLMEQYGRYALYAGGAFSLLAIVCILYAFFDRNNQYDAVAYMIANFGITFAVLATGCGIFYGITLLDAANAERHAEAMDQWRTREKEE